MLYADSAEGFRPSLEMIRSRTGIAKNKVSEKRKRLVEYRFIDYEWHIKIQINWKRIRIYAQLDPSMTGKQRRYHRFPNVNLKPRKTIGKINQEIYHANIPEAPKTDDQEKFYRWMEDLTVKELEPVIQEWKKCGVHN